MRRLRPRPAGPDVDGLPRRGGRPGPARDRVPALAAGRRRDGRRRATAAADVAGAAVRRLRRVRPDGRPVLVGPRPRALGRRLRRRLPAAGRRRRRRTRCAGRRGARCSSSTGLIPPRVVAPAVDEPAALRGGGYGFGLVVEQDPRWGAAREPQRRLPGLRVPHALAPGQRDRRRRPGEQHVRPERTDRAAPGHRAARGRDGRRSSGRPAARRTEPAGRPRSGRRCGRRRRRPGTPWPATLAAMEAVERLLRRLGRRGGHGALVAENVDLDEPLAVRREAFAAAAALAGPGGFARDPAAPPEHESPAHALWWLRGGHGRVRLEVRLTPHPGRSCRPSRSPRWPPSARRCGRRSTRSRRRPRVAAPGWPAVARRSRAALDPEAAARQVRVAAAFAGRCRVGPVLACDGARTALVRLVGERACVELAVGRRPGGRGPPAADRARGAGVRGDGLTGPRRAARPAGGPTAALAPPARLRHAA